MEISPTRLRGRLQRAGGAQALADKCKGKDVVVPFRNSKVLEAVGSGREKEENDPQS